jgi:endonuclease YncB( thermonuclease family)
MQTKTLNEQASPIKALRSNTLRIKALEMKALQWRWAWSLGSALLLGGGAADAATVLSIETGDTLRVRQGNSVQTIRLACLDAPELDQAPYGAKAREALQRLVPVGSSVSLSPPTQANASTALAEVYNIAGNVNLELVRTGQAFGTLSDQPRCDSLRYAEAENTAQFRRLGVWQLEGGLQRPWLWQTARKEAEERKRREEMTSATLTQGHDSRFLPPNPSSASPQRRLPLASDMALSGSYPKCLADFRKGFMDGSIGIAPPKTLAETFCSCATRPKSNDTLTSLRQRCTTALQAKTYPLCLAKARQQFLLASSGLKPPKGVLETYCTCLTKPKTNDTSLTLSQRCTTILQERLVSRLPQGGATLPSGSESEA